MTTMTNNAHEQRLAQTFVALSDTLVDDFDLLDFLTLLAERAAELLDVTAAGVILSDQRGGWHPTAASSEDARLLELFAIQTHEGPCQDCIRDAAPVSSSDFVGEDSRWPAFTEAAMSAGFRAAAAVPLRLRHDIVGALTLLNTEPVGVNEASLQLGQGLADVATVGLLHQRSVRRSELLSEQLQATLHHRVVIEQAKGVLAEHGQLTMQQSFELLRGYARANGLHLSELARSTVEGAVDPASLLAYESYVGLQAP
ncbi:GAF and ANTAR domain-containing protein [Parasphingorhabdus pacifica]